MNLYLVFTPNSITKLLLKIISCLLISNLICIYLKWELGINTGFGFVPLFDFDQEFNIPTMYSALAILFSAALLWFIAKNSNRRDTEKTFYWKGLCFIFIFLSLDELTSIHNQFSRLTSFIFKNFGPIINQEILSQSRFWIITYLPLLLCFFIFFMKFYWQLPRQTKVSFLLSGTTFIAGAIGVELLGDTYMYSHDKPDFNYGLICTLEELLEMLGIVLFIRSLLSYIVIYSLNPQVNIQLTFAKKNYAV